MKQELNLIDENGKEIQCKVVAIWHKGNDSYIAYTDGTITDGKEEIFASKFVNKDGSIELVSIDSDAEWDYVDEYLNDNIFSIGDLDD